MTDDELHLVEPKRHALIMDIGASVTEREVRMRRGPDLVLLALEAMRVLSLCAAVGFLVHALGIVKGWW